MGESVWFLVERAYYIIEKGTLLAAAAETDQEFHVEAGDIVEIHRPLGGVLRTRVNDVCENPNRPSGDLLVEGLRKGEVPEGSRVRLVKAGKRGRHGPR